MFQKSIFVGKTFTLILVFLLGMCLQSNAFQVQVMSYNIRYDNPDDAPNTWDNRKDRVANLINFYEPVFLGTQEAELHQLQYLDKHLTQYNWIGKGRNGGNDGEFSALFYDTTRAELVAQSDSTIWLSKTPAKPSKDWDAALPRILTWGQFKLKSSGKSLYVFNTHFDHIGDTARTESAKIILETINKVAGSNSVVLTGDFNILDTSKPYQILTSSFLEDAYNNSDLPNVGPSFTFSGFSVHDTSDQKRIDFIFTNGRVDVSKHAIITSFQNGFYPSDHLPVVAEIDIN